MARGDSHGGAARMEHQERAVWQRRYWEHTCRDEDALRENEGRHGLSNGVEAAF
jgi:hypothetical protein